MWPPSVTKELRHRKGKNRKVFDLLKTGITSEEKALKSMVIHEVSKTDSDVIALAVEREKKLQVARLYQNRKKTVRQCAEMLNVDPEEMMDILIEFRISFGHDDIEQQLETVEKIVKQMQAA
jgi:rRNA maturation endonuclease Nob1